MDAATTIEMQTAKKKSGLSIIEGLAAKLYAQADNKRTESERLLFEAKALSDAADILMLMQRG